MSETYNEEYKKYEKCTKCGKYKKDCGHECMHQHKKEECCCKESMEKALKLLWHECLEKYVNFKEFAFVGRRFLVGAKYGSITGYDDNIYDLSAEFKGFINCNEDLIKVEAYKLYYPTPDDQDRVYPFDVDYMSICDIDAVAFNLKYADYEEYKEFKERLTELLDRPKVKCHEDYDECCCNDGIFEEVFNPWSSEKIDITAGWLAVKDAKVLGKIGSVLVLANTEIKRIYFICLDAVGFIGK